MPITAITYQPVNALNSAYRPIVFKCKATTGAVNRICPVVYCDIYVNDVYFKTLSKTQFSTDDGVSAEYEFDIQDAMQELMEFQIPKVNGTTLEEYPQAIKSVYVKFRNAILDPKGFTISEQQAPIMATSSSPAVSGEGTRSANVIIVNILVQHEENQNVPQLLSSYKTGVWKNDSFPLTKRPRIYQLCKKDSSHFPIMTDSKIQKICVRYKSIYGAVAEFCQIILTPCPIITGLAYSVARKNETQQTFTFSWDNTTDSRVTGMNIYFTSDIAEDNGYEVIKVSKDSPCIIDLPYDKFTFRFSFDGSCKVDEDMTLMPGFIDIGLDNQIDPPTVSLKWLNSNSFEDRVCNSTSCPIDIKIERTGLEQITNTEILLSVDNGVTWTSFIGNTTNSYFSDTISQPQTRKYKAVCSYVGGTAESNVLTYSKAAGANIYITDVSVNTTLGETTFKLHVENMAFVGFANTVVTKGDNCKIASVSADPYGASVSATSQTAPGVDKFGSQAVNIPIGIYDCQVDVSCVPISIKNNASASGAISFGYTTSYYDGIVDTSVHIIIPGTSQPE